MPHFPFPDGHERRVLSANLRNTHWTLLLKSDAPRPLFRLVYFFCLVRIGGYVNQQMLAGQRVGVRMFPLRLGPSTRVAPLVLMRLHGGPGERTYRWEYPRRLILRFGVAGTRTLLLFKWKDSKITLCPEWVQLCGRMEKLWVALF